MDNDFLIELRDALKSVEDSEYPVLARAYYRRKIIAISTGCPVCCSIHGRGSSSDGFARPTCKCRRAHSSVVERCPDKTEVLGSIPSAPTAVSV